MQLAKKHRKAARKHLFAVGRICCNRPMTVYELCTHCTVCGKTTMTRARDMPSLIQALKEVWNA